MLFNSFEFLCAFLPVVFLGYFLLNRKKWTLLADGWLIAASLFFYCFWSWKNLPLFAASIVFNYLLGSALALDKIKMRRKLIVGLGITVNIVALAYFKYSGFLVQTINQAFHSHLSFPDLFLPLAISFFTFQQIEYLINCYRREIRSGNLREYLLFISFFPKLISGPITGYNEIVPQFQQKEKRGLDARNLSWGLFLFSIGLFKKTVISSTIASSAWPAYHAGLTMLEAWGVCLSYTLQLYYDFSGYSDMAIGIALLFNIQLPFNFNSPLRRASLQELWRNWHMSLTRWLTKYLYFPMGGSRVAPARVYFNVFVVFLVCGIWHGSGWGFVVFGAMHGVGMGINRFWRLNALPFLSKRLGRDVQMPYPLGWLLTFGFFSLSLVPFAAPSLKETWVVWKAMFAGPFDAHVKLNWMIGAAVCLMLVLFFPNSQHMPFKRNLKYALFTGVLLLLGVLNITTVSEFIYFQF